MVFVDVIVGGLLGFVLDALYAAFHQTNSDSAGFGMVVVILIGIIVIFAIHFSIYSWYVKTYIKRYYYAGEDHFITIKKGVFAPAEIHVQWQKIQDVYVDQDILDRMMGLYDVHIASATAASGIEAHIDGVDKTSADGLKEFLLNKVSNAGRGNFTNTNTPNGPIGMADQNFQSAMTQAAAPTQSPQAKINLTEEISSAKYPLNSKWVTVNIIGRIIGGFTSTLFLVIIIVANLKNASLFNYWVDGILIWLGLGIIFSVGRIITLFLWKKNYTFNFTQDNIYYKDGVISLSEKHMPYSSIQDVTIQQGVIERMFGLAKVRIENAAQAQMIPTRNGKVSIFSGIILQGLSVADANHITEVLKSSVLNRSTTNYGL